MAPNVNSFPETQTHCPEQGPKLVIAGGSRLSGHVHISGSKNSALSILAATLCCTGPSKLNNVPNVSDIRAMASILASVGARVEFSGNQVLVDAGRARPTEPDPALMGEIRGGFFILGPLLARFGEAVVGLPGGCNIGARPVDIYVSGLRALGAYVEVSVGATQTLMMAACMASGTTLLSNVAKEPEIVDLARFLTKAGAHIQGSGTNKIRIYGTNRLKGSEHDITPDRIETGTFMLAAAITRSSISMSPVADPCSLSCLVNKLSSVGCNIAYEHNVSGEELLVGFDVKTEPYPGFPTDLQPQTMALLATCRGSSLVEESVFENRMSHVKELQKLGAKIEVREGRAFVHGIEASNKLRGSRVVAGDLRGGAALVLAGLAAEGVTEVYEISHIERGYEDFHKKLQLLGADIKRIDCSKASNFGS
ncbi:UDP-N-acetylglucosamine1-carboxyvinyltransferase [Striga asiatica]|uniref:UDP-N-acetylglucosamine 1-carboxyvinyltransferase n=1 Tax=Striga asiatica TaxID=4170 RepID=A0A5A7QWS0_STRAF|nr:UDP-N-acetylglucosamine1-carboxyvinyltransferase [Striga asiatica]